MSEFVMFLENRMSDGLSGTRRTCSFLWTPPEPTLDRLEHTVQQVRKSRHRVEDLPKCRPHRHQEMTRRLGQISGRTRTC